MANLLTSDIKKRLGQDLFGRKLVVVGLSFGVLLLVAAITLSTFWVSLFIRQSGLAETVSSLGGKAPVASSGPSDPAALLKKVELELKTLNNFWSEPLISELVAKSLSSRPSGIKILNLSFERGLDNKSVKFSVSGLAASRASLVAYVNLLKKEKTFSRVDLPVESLISDQGGQFVINLEQ